MSFPNFTPLGSPKPENDQAGPDELLQAEEREATRRVLTVWSWPEGRVPWLTLLLVAASVVVTILALSKPEPVYGALYANGIEIWLSRKVWGVIGSLFIHGDWLHLIFNCYWVWLFGRLLERELGPVRFLGVVLGGALVGGAAELAWSGDLGIGMSGVVYAFFGFLLVDRARHPDFRRILPVNTRWLMIGWLGFCFALTYTGVLAVANFAHLGGLLIGCLAGGAASSSRWAMRARLGFVAATSLSVAVLWAAPWQETWQMAEAYRALEAKDEPRALATLEKIRAKDTQNLWALRQEATLRWQRGDYALYRTLLKDLVAAEGSSSNLNELAWLLATCPDAAIRDGAEAVRLATRACSADEWKTAAFIDTLAAAYAEAGDFGEAEKQMERALKIDDAANRDVYQRHLEAFRAGRAWREPVAAAGVEAQGPG